MTIEETVSALIDQRVAASVRAALADLPARPEPPALVPTNGLCEQLGISRSTIDRLRAVGLPTVMIGDAPRFSVAKVIAWLEARGSVSASAGQ